MPSRCSKRRGDGRRPTSPASKPSGTSGSPRPISAWRCSAAAASPPSLTGVLRLEQRHRAAASIRQGQRTMLSRRNFLGGSAVALASVAAIGSRSEAAAIPEAPTTESPAMQPPIAPHGGQDYQPVVTLNGWTLPWRMNGGWKEFHLVAEPVLREFAPGMTVNLWGYNGQSAGPDHRGGRGRQGPHLRHQQAPRAHHGALARHDPAERHGRRRRPDPAAHQAGQDLRLRVRAEEERHLHVPPPFRRDGADGDGHDGHVRGAPERIPGSAASIATSASS